VVVKILGTTAMHALRVEMARSACYQSPSWNSNVAIRAILFDLGNTLVGY